MAGGRPTKYNPEYCEQIVEFMSQGASQVEFAAYIGVAKQTIHEWTQVHPEFSAARDMAMAKCEAWWAKKGREHLINIYQGDNLNTSNYQFHMKARFGWRDQDKTIQAPEENPVVDQEIHSLANTEK